MGKRVIIKNTKLTPGQQELISSNYKLVWKLFNKWRPISPLNDDDLYDTCIETLLYAARIYDKNKGTKFSTCMFNCAKGFMFNKVRDNNSNSRKINEGIYSLNRRISKDPENNETLLTLIESYDNYYFIDRELIEMGLSVITEREKECITYNIIYDKSLEDTRKLMSLETKQGVINTKNRALKKMRDVLLNIPQEAL